MFPIPRAPLPGNWGEVKMEREANSCVTSVAEGGGGRLVREGPGNWLESWTGKGPRPVDAKEESREDREEAVSVPGWAPRNHGDRCSSAHPVLHPNKCAINWKYLKLKNAQKSQV